MVIKNYLHVIRGSVAVKQIEIEISNTNIQGACDFACRQLRHYYPVYTEGFLYERSGDGHIFVAKTTSRVETSYTIIGDAK